MTEVLWTDETGVRRICSINETNDKTNTNTNTNTYDLILPERNVLLEQLYFIENTKENETQEIKKGMLLLYLKNNKYQEAYLSKIDWNSQSAQIRIFRKDIPKNQVIFLDE